MVGKRRGRKTMIRTILTWLAVAMVLFYVVKHPGQTAGALKGIASGIGDFVTSLAS
jgi:hypothetical protein